MTDIFDEAYRARSPLFGETPTHMLAEFMEGHEIKGAVLELGCGDGRDTLSLLQRGLRVTALDRSTVAIQKLRHRCAQHGVPATRLAAHAIDVLKWDWARECFDLVMAVTLLDHLTAEDGRDVAGRMITAAKSGGVVFVEVHTVEDPGNRGDDTVSEFADAIRHYFGLNELLAWFWPSMRVLMYHERKELDLDHGQPHYHGVATILARKERVEVSL